MECRWLEGGQGRSHGGRPGPCDNTAGNDSDGRLLDVSGTGRPVAEISGRRALADVVLREAEGRLSEPSTLQIQAAQAQMVREPERHVRGVVEQR
ncbi:hypothetical protein [Streptomyces sp. NPDC005752]|uniref:hypothetical protein n=1 Tax=Streptomyces sp. NPDC005752 TaxID=3157065 RepID=UPI0033FD3A60